MAFTFCCERKTRLEPALRADKLAIFALPPANCVFWALPRPAATACYHTSLPNGLR